MAGKAGTHRSTVWGDESPTRREVRRRRDRKQSARDIAAALDISTQAVYRHLAGIRALDAKRAKKNGRARGGDAA